jgi:hypothetical protein
MTSEQRNIISVNTTSELKERLKEYAKSKRWSMSEAAEYFIEKGLEQEHQPQAPKPKE